MDRKAIAVLVVSFALLLLWSPLVNHWFPPTRITATNELGVASGSTYGADPALTNLPTVSSLAATNRSLPMPSSAPLARYTGTEEKLVVTNSNARYTFT